MLILAPTSKDAALSRKILEEAGLECAVCRDVGDRLTPQRFLAASIEHLTKIAAVIEKLRRLQGPEDRQQLKMWEDVVATLRRLSTAVEPAPALAPEPEPVPKK